MERSDLEDIKRRLLKEHRLETIYEAMGCSHVKHVNGKTERIEAQLPDRFFSSNKRSVQTKLNKSLTSTIRSRADFRSGDIFGLVSYIVHDKRGNDINKDLYNAKTFICETLGWNEYLTGEYEARKDYVAPLKAILKGKRKRREVEPNPVIPEEILQDYYYKGKPLPYKDWIDEGISYETQVLYGVGFDLDSHRIIIPMRNRFGQLVGVKGRIAHDEESELKYLYLHRFYNSIEWFNFHHAYPYILMAKRVYIFEAEKSCMKAYQNDILNTLSIGASEISDEQVHIIKQLGLDIEIVLCYDKGIDQDIVDKTASFFEGRKVFIMQDKDNLLEGKESPVDRGKAVWDKLVEDYIFEEKTEKVVENK